MRNDRRDDAHEIDIVALNDITPIGFDIFDPKLARDSFRVFAMSAGDRDNACALAILEAGNLVERAKPAPMMPI